MKAKLEKWASLSIYGEKSTFTDMFEIKYSCLTSYRRGTTVSLYLNLSVQYEAMQVNIKLCNQMHNTREHVTVCLGYCNWMAKTNCDFQVEENRRYRVHTTFEKAFDSIFINMREVVNRYQMKKGRYVIIPSTYDPNQAGKFMLRIFTEKSADATWVVFSFDSGD